MRHQLVQQLQIFCSHGVAERHPLEAVVEKCAQRPAHRLAGLRTPISGVALDVARDVLLADPAEVAGTGRANLVQKPADRR